ncbi:dynein heavy chain domain-containing protein 1 isoform X2 [Petromyzon marinus]|uniref:dynein heavy chain domain-containing protein 1 isoform X2 n=1 Tax=Petromyzon marinus TaxID=7757 RepID=UPI003F6F5D9B
MKMSRVEKEEASTKYDGPSHGQVDLRPTKGGDVLAKRFVVECAADDPDSWFNPRPVTLGSLQTSVGVVGMEAARAEAVWQGSPGLMAAAFNVQLPPPPKAPPVTVDVPKPPAESAPILTDGAKRSNTRTTKRLDQEHLSGTEAAEILARDGHMGLLKFVRFTTSPDRPYELQPMHAGQSHQEHWVLSPLGALHVQADGIAESQPLAEWCEHADLCRAVQSIPYFRHFLLRKAFHRWYRNVRWVQFHRRKEHLECTLLHGVGHFSTALLQISRLLEELDQVPFLPWDLHRSYTLTQFQQTLADTMAEARERVIQFFHCREVIFRMVHAETYRQLEVCEVRCAEAERSDPREGLAERRELLRLAAHDRSAAEGAVRRLGRLAHLMDALVLQRLRGKMQCEATRFTRGVVQGRTSGQTPLFHAVLEFDAEGHLQLTPTGGLFVDALETAVENMTQTVLQVATCMTKDTESPDSTGNADEMGEDELANLSVTGHLGGSAALLTLAETSELSVRGTRVRARFCPLSPHRLQVSLQGDGTVSRARSEQMDVVHCCLSHVTEFCREHHWLCEPHRVAQAWDGAALAGATPEQLCGDVEELRAWVQKASLVPGSFLTPKNTFHVDCSVVRREIVSPLRRAEQEVLVCLEERCRDGAERSLSDLQRATHSLLRRDTDCVAFARYVEQLHEFKKCSGGFKAQLQNVNALHEVLRVTFRPLSNEEEERERQTTTAWEGFLRVLEDGENFVLAMRAAAVRDADTSLSRLMAHAEAVAAEAATPPYTVPVALFAAELARLSSLGSEIDSIANTVDELSRAKAFITGEPVSLFAVQTHQKVVSARLLLWKVFHHSSESIRDWTAQPFSQFSVGSAKDEVERWKAALLHVEGSLVSDDAVLIACQSLLGELAHNLQLLEKLGSTFFKDRHWEAVLARMGQRGDFAADFTIAQLLSLNLVHHHNSIVQVWRMACAEHALDMELRRQHAAWAQRDLVLAAHMWFLPPTEPHGNSPGGQQHQRLATPSGTFIFADIDELRALIEDDTMALRTLTPPVHEEELQGRAETWIDVLHHLDDMLDLWVTLQAKWLFLSKVFNEMGLQRDHPQLAQKFHSEVDKVYRDVVQAALDDPSVLSVLGHRREYATQRDQWGLALRTMLASSISTAEQVFGELTRLTDSSRERFARLFFLPDEDIMGLLSCAFNAHRLLPFVTRCFPGVVGLGFDASPPPSAGDGSEAADPALRACADPLSIVAAHGEVGEVVRLREDVRPRYCPIAWLQDFERSLASTGCHQLAECVAFMSGEPFLDPSEIANSCIVRRCNFGIWNGPEEDITEFLIKWNALLATFSVQYIVVASEVLWTKFIILTLRENGNQIQKAKDVCNTQLGRLVFALRWHMSQGSTSKDATRLHLLLSCLITRTCNQRDSLASVRSEGSFEWQKLMKYYLGSDVDADVKHVRGVYGGGAEGPGCRPSSTMSSESQWSCWVEQLGFRFSYEHEYLGPCATRLVMTPMTERCLLGLVLALNDCATAALFGRAGVGKSAIASELAFAFGRLLVSAQCSQQLLPGDVSRLVRGAARCGALLVLEHADQLPAGTLSILSQQILELQAVLKQAWPFRRDNSSAHSHTSHCVDKNTVPSNVDHDLRNCVCGTHDAQDKSSISESFRLVNFEDTCLHVNPSFGFILTFIESPANSGFPGSLMSSAFRSVSVLTPSIHVIVEVLLLAEGFCDSFSLAAKVSSFCQAADRCGFLRPVGKMCHLLAIKCILKEASKIYHARILADNIEDGNGSATKGDSTDSYPCSPRHPPLSTNSGLSYRKSLHEESAVCAAFHRVNVLFRADSLREAQHLLGEFMPSFINAREGRSSESCLEFQSAVHNQIREDNLQVTASGVLSVQQLHQSLQAAPGVILLGRPGSGKTTAYQTLAKVINRLHGSGLKTVGCSSAGFRGESDELENAGGHGMEDVESPDGILVRTSVIFPNCLSLEDLVGSGYNNKVGQQGIVQKLLRSAGVEEEYDAGLAAPGNTLNISLANKPMPNKTRSFRQTWIVFDGNFRQDLTEALATYFKLACGSSSTLSDWPKAQGFNKVSFIFETSDLAHASPAALAWLPLVSCCGEDQWRNILESWLEGESIKLGVTHGEAQAWRSLAEDVFPPTLAFLRRNPLALAPCGGSAAPDGVQEVASFLGFITALLETFPIAPRQEECGTKDGQGLAGASLPQDVPGWSCGAERAVALFLFSYVWGFGGRLETRHWGEFDSVARRVLSTSRHGVTLPECGTVFELWPEPPEGRLAVWEVSQASATSNPRDGFANFPQHKRYARLVEMLASAGSPCLLLSQSGSLNKEPAATWLFRSLCTPGRALFGQGGERHRVAVSPCLEASRLRQVLREKLSLSRVVNLSAKGENVLGSGSRAERAPFLVFLDDLHLAEVDVKSSSQPLVEVTRQLLSMNSVYDPERMQSASFYSAPLNILASWVNIGEQSRAVPARLARLFTTLTLPAVTEEHIFTVCVPSLLVWLQELPTNALVHPERLADALVRATWEVISQMRERLKLSQAEVCCPFSLSSVGEILSSLLSVSPKSCVRGSESPSAVACRLVRLWSHEAWRTLGDGLCTAEGEDAFQGILLGAVQKNVIVGLSSMSGEFSTESLNQRPRHHRRAALSLDTGIAFSAAASSSTLQANMSTYLHLSSMSGSEAADDDYNDDGKSHLFRAAHSLAAQDERAKPASADAQCAERITARVTTPRLTGWSVRSSYDSCTSGNKSDVNMAHSRSGKRSGKKKPADEPPTGSKELPLTMGDILHHGEQFRDILYCNSSVLAPTLTGLLPYRGRAHHREVGWQELAHVLEKRSGDDGVTEESTRRAAALCRALCRPASHALLIGLGPCTGRRALVRLAAGACRASVFELAEGASTGGGATIDESLRQQIKMACWHAGAEAKPAVLLATNWVVRRWHAQLVALAREGMFPELYSSADLKEISEKLSGSSVSKDRLAKVDRRSQGSVERFFRRVRNHLHVVTLVDAWQSGDEEEAELTRGRNFASLVTMATSVSVHSRWGRRTLVHVARRRLEFLHATVKVHVSAYDQHRICAALASVHQSAETLALESLGNWAQALFPPEAFLDAVDLFFSLHNQIDRHRHERIHRLGTALSRVQEVERTVEEWEEQMVELKSELESSQELVQQLQSTSDRKHRELEEALERCRQTEEHISALLEQLEALRKKMRAQLNQVSPVYEAALRALRALRPRDVEELRSYRAPPPPVVAVADAVGLLFGCHAGWEDARILMLRPNFLQDLEFLDKDGITDETFERLEAAVLDPGLSPALVRESSRAADSLCSWLRAVYAYGRTRRLLRPAELEAAALEAALATARRSLGRRRLHAEQLSGERRHAVEELEGAALARDGLLARIHDARLRLQEGAHLRAALLRQKGGWESLNREARALLSAAAGDALLASASAVYAAPFDGASRRRLLVAWLRLCLDGDGKDGDSTPAPPSRAQQVTCDGDPKENVTSDVGEGDSTTGPGAVIPVRTPFSLRDALGSEEEDERWHQEDLPSYAGAREAFLMAHVCARHVRRRRCLFFLDPDGQAATWVRLIEREVASERNAADQQRGASAATSVSGEEQQGSDLQVLMVTDPALEQRLVGAAERGATVLITHVEREDITSWLKDLLSQERPWGATEDERSFTLGGQVVTARHGFRLYLATSLPLALHAARGAGFLETLLEVTSVLDVSVEAEGLHDLVLQELLRTERPRYSGEQHTLTRDLLFLNKQACVQQDNLIGEIADSPTSLIENKSLVPFIESTEKNSAQTRDDRSDTELLCARHEATRRPYQPIARRCVAIFTALRRTAHLNALYFMPAAEFLSSVKRALPARDSRVFADGTALSVPEVRALELIHTLTEKLYAQVAPGMLHAHARMLAFLIAAEDLNASAAELTSFARMLADEDRSEVEGDEKEEGFGREGEEGAVPSDHRERPGWIPRELWQTCYELEKRLPHFHDLRRCLAQDERAWREYFGHSGGVRRGGCTTLLGPLPSRELEHLDIFQRAVLWTAFRPDSVADVISAVAVSRLGGDVAERNVPSLAEMLAAAPSNRSRAVLLLVEEVDTADVGPMQLLQELSGSAQRTVRMLSLGWRGERLAERLAEEVNLCAERGLWLVLHGLCHAPRDWPPRAASLLQRVLTHGEDETVLGQEDARVHPDFRLWLVATMDSAARLPGIVLERALRFVCRAQPRFASKLASCLSCVETSEPSNIGVARAVSSEERRVTAAQATGGTGHAAHPRDWSTALARLHAVLLHRRGYGRPAVVRPYSWSRSDLIMALNLFTHLNETCQDFSAALEYLLGSVVYGGYITHRQDLEVVESIVKHCLPSYRPGGALHAGGVYAFVRALTAAAGSSSFSTSELGFFTEPEPSNFGLCDGTKEKVARQRSHQAKEQLRLCTSDNWPTPASHPGPKRRWLPRLAVDSHSEYLGGHACMAKEPGQTEDETHTGLASSVEGTRPSLKSFFRSQLEDFRLHAMAPFQGAWSLRSEDGWKRSVCPLVEEDDEEDEEDEAAPSWALGGCRESDTEPVVRLLSRQSELLSAYAATDHVVSYNLAALSRPETFLISLMRIAAYKEKTLPHRCVLHAQVLSGFVAPDAAPAEGVYLTGLHLHNALWDTRLGALQETVSAQPCTMPLVWLRCATLTQAKSNSSGGSWTVGAAWKTRAEVDALIVKAWSDGTQESRHHQDPWAGTLHATTATASDTSMELPEGRRAQSTKCHRQRMEGRFQNNQRPMERTTSRSAGSLGRKGTACSREAATARLFPVYGCPLHVLSPCRGSPARSHVVAYVELPSMVDPTVCAQRRVHLTCSLE